MKRKIERNGSPDKPQTDHDPNCCFCPQGLKGRTVRPYGSVLAFADRNPVSEGHHLIVPKRHVPDWFSMNEQERRDADTMIEMLRTELIASDPHITGFNIGMNCGRSAGQSIFHAHIHLIPRRDGDTPDPLGGVRGVIPRKMGYRPTK
jgi:ATP adenylyltransferase